GIGLAQLERRAAGFATNTRGARMARLGTLAVCVAAVAWCLVLTKSRSAYVAAAVGVALLPLLDARVRSRVLNWRFALGVAAVLAVLIGAGLATGGLDVQVLTEAKKSLGYRLEYWQTTLAMIGRHPWLGVGPGNFQEFYTQFKLPEASEEVRDPHNFLLEVWA